MPRSFIRQEMSDTFIPIVEMRVAAETDEGPDNREAGGDGRLQPPRSRGLPSFACILTLYSSVTHHSEREHPLSARKKWRCPSKHPAIHILQAMEYRMAAGGSLHCETYVLRESSDSYSITHFD